MLSVRLLGSTEQPLLSFTRGSALLYPKPCRTSLHPGFTANSAAIILCPQARAFSSSSPRRDYHFDTHKFVERLEREGLNRPQAEGIMMAMAEVIDESIRSLTQNMVTKAEQEKVRPRSPMFAWPCAAE
jgi:hypothetical protein